MIPRNEYPRPNFIRKQWLNLNGEWDFEFDDENKGEKEKWYLEKEFSRKIKVPFTYETKLSGIGDSTPHGYVWYKRKFTLPPDWKDKNIILHFGAVDYIAKIWINGEYVGNHIGGYTPFSFDITNYIRWEKPNIIVVKVEDDPFSKEQARGKQTWIESNFGCWYTRTTGIWQTVWIEPVSQIYLKNVKMTPDIKNGRVLIEAFLNKPCIDAKLNCRISFDDIDITNISVDCIEKTLKFSLNVYSNRVSEWGLKLWHPDEPNLYDIEFLLIHKGEVIDEVKSYFGMREIRVYEGKVLLNGRPFYQKLILDQGYWPESGITPPDEESIIYDIKVTKELGFNGVRKHQKVEDPLYLYWADKLGLVVWGEMASFYDFTDTAMNNYVREWQEIIERDYNHPCIIVWTPFNESWGIPGIGFDKRKQAYTVSVVNMIRALDPTRLVVSNDGWEHTDTDLVTIHDYEQDAQKFLSKYIDKEIIFKSSPIGHNIFAEGYDYKGQPILITEYGGIAYRAQNGWGYGEIAKTEEEFLRRFKALHDAICSIKYVCGYCYTQLTDVEQEMNGLMTFYRKLKVSMDKIREIIGSKN